MTLSPIIVHGYGRFDLSKIFFKTYVNKIQQYCEQYNRDTIIASGGYTDAAIQESEAASLQRVRQENKGKVMHWYLEERSLTTIENILYSSEILEKLCVDTIYICASTIHLPKIIYYALQYYLKKTKNEALEIIQHTIRSQQNVFGGDNTDITFSYEGMVAIGCDLGYQPSDYMKALRSSILETHYDEVPELHVDFIQYRKKIRGLS